MPLLLQRAMVSDVHDNGVMHNVFVVNKPRDIVSGDFRWHKETEKFHYLAVADCTGHGIPGAMLSVIGSTILNSYLSSQDDVTPGQLLEVLDEQFTSSINMASEGSRRDGMDISMVRISKENLKFYLVVH